MAKVKMDYEIERNNMSNIGVFISYAHKDKEYLDNIKEYFKLSKVNILSDELISAGSSDFHKDIKNMLVRSTCAIVLFNDLLSPWMLFEIGVLKGLGKKIFIYNINNNDIPNYLSDCEMVQTLDVLKEKCEKITLFNDLFENDSHIYNQEDYNDYIRNKMKFISLKIRIPGIEKIDTNAFQFRYIIPGMFKMEDTIQRNIDECYKEGEELEFCECQCYKKYKYCPYNNFDIPANKKEIIILNKIYDAIKVDHYEIEYLIPVNEEHGVTFKCFVDIKDFSLKDKIIELLISSGVISADESGSAATDRIYFTIPKKISHGLFEVYSVEGFSNNYLCPGSLE